MTSSPLSDDLALRIGLAARELPETDPKRLVTVLLAHFGGSITEAGLEGLKVKDLKGAADGELASLPAEALKTATAILRGETHLAPTDDLPQVEAYSDGDLPGSIRVAFASNQADLVNGHFGSCARFLVYQVSQEGTRLVAIRGTDHIMPEMDKNEERSNLISDCQLLYIASIGGPAAAKVVKVGVHPIKLPAPERAGEVLDKLKEVLGGTPPPWLARIMGRETGLEERFAEDSLEEEA